MSLTPLVSVIMPVYNGERYLREAIESVLVQTFTDFALLIMDDGSTDDSINIIRSYRDSRIRVLSAPHQGLVPVLNKALVEAQGDYIARMDADDIAAPHRLEKQVTYMLSRPDVVLVGSWARLIDMKGKPVGISWAEPSGGWRLYASLCSSNQFIHGSIMMRRQAALAVGGYRSAFATAEDYDLWLRLGEVGELANIPESLYKLRVHQSSKSIIEGSKIVDIYTDRARRCALQRYLLGRDYLGYAAPCPIHGAEGDGSKQRPGLTRVTLSERAQIFLWQGQLHLALRLLCRALVHRPRDAAWSVVPPRCFNKAYAREVLHAVQRGSWVELGQAKAHRIFSRMMERANA